MTIPNLKNDAERVNLEAESPAFHKLCSDSWAVQIPRSVATSNRFDAVVVYAAACAWRDRGQGFGHTDDEGVFTRNAAAIPPGGWPALVGVTPPTWRRWRDAAVSAKLIKIESSPERLLRPLVERQDGEQWARVEVAFLFHRELSKRTRRAFVALSLFRQKDDSVSMSIRKIGKDAGLEKRHVRRALRELEAMGALQSVGQTSHGIHRYMVIKAPLPVNFDRTTVNFGPPKLLILAPLKNLLHESLYHQESISGRIRRTRRRAQTENPILNCFQGGLSEAIRCAALGKGSQGGQRSHQGGRHVHGHDRRCRTICRVLRSHGQDRN